MGEMKEAWIYGTMIVIACVALFGAVLSNAMEERAASQDGLRYPIAAQTAGPDAVAAQ
jgi:hypothetical protein